MRYQHGGHYEFSADLQRDIDHLLQVEPITLEQLQYHCRKHSTTLGVMRPHSSSSNDPDLWIYIGYSSGTHDAQELCPIEFGIPRISFGRSGEVRIKYNTWKILRGSSRHEPDSWHDEWLTRTGRDREIVEKQYQALDELLNPQFSLWLSYEPRLFPGNKLNELGVLDVQAQDYTRTYVFPLWVTAQQWEKAKELLK